MIQNASIFSKEEEEVKVCRKLMASRCLENISFSKKKLNETGDEVEVIKEFHIEISSNGETTILEYNRGEVLGVVRNLFKKYVYLGNSPSGFMIICEIDNDYFKMIQE